MIGSFWDMLKKFYIPKKIEVNVRCDIRFEGKVFEMCIRDRATLI